MTHVLEARSLAKTYDTGGAKVLALRGFDLAIERGEFVAIMGSSGSGKSTLINLLGGLIGRPRRKSGSTATDRPAEPDRACTGSPPQIGFVFQDFNLCPPRRRTTTSSCLCLWSAGGARPRGGPRSSC